MCIAIRSPINAICRHIKGKLGTITASTLSMRCVQCDRYKGYHKVERETAASERERLLMTHTTHNVVISLLHCLNHFLQCNLQEARRLIFCLDLHTQTCLRALPLLIDDCCHCLDDQLAQFLLLLPIFRLNTRSHPGLASCLFG